MINSIYDISKSVLKVNKNYVSHTPKNYQIFVIFHLAM